MAETSSATEIWIQRVEAWRASGMRAEVFSQQEGYPAGTLRWWASKFKRELGESTTTPKVTKASRAKRTEVRLARVVRPTPVVPVEAKFTPVILELAHAGVRITVDVTTDRTTLAWVLEVLGVARGART